MNLKENNIMISILRNLNLEIKLKLQKVFYFDTYGFIRLRKHMKNVEFNSLVYDKNKTLICLPENNLSDGNESIYYSTHMHKQTKAEEYEFLKISGLDYSHLKKNKTDNELPF